MTLKHFDTSSIGPGVQGELGMADSGIVSENAILASTDDNGVEGHGSHQSLKVFGSVLADKVAVVLGGDLSAFSAPNRDVHVLVGADGYISGLGGIMMLASNSDIENKGMISGQSFGVLAGGWDLTTKVTVDNSGTIGGQFVAVEFASRSDAIFNNSGVVKGVVDNGVFSKGGSAPSGGDLTVNNTGKIFGSDLFGGVLLGIGNGTYNGVGGTVHGFVSGGAGNDRLIGGGKTEFLSGDGGADKLTGNRGADHFLFGVLSDSKVNPAGMDLITDFRHAQHDVIDVSGIDADTSDVDDSAFFFGGTHKFRGFAGELRYEAGGHNTMVYADVDGDKHADFQLELRGVIHLAKGDFDL